MAGAAGIDSDDFSGGTFPSAFWTEVNNDTTASITRTGEGTVDAWAELYVDDTVDHEFWGTAHDAVRLEQSCTNADFTIETRIESAPTENGQELGIYVGEDPSSDGTVVCALYYDSGEYKLAASDIVETVPFYNAETTLAPPFKLRIQYTASNGEFNFYATEDTWGAAFATGTPSPIVTPAVVGMYSANWNATPRPVTTAKFDYFWEITDPIDPEDPPTGGVRRVMVIS